MIPQVFAISLKVSPLVNRENSRRCPDVSDLSYEGVDSLLQGGGIDVSPILAFYGDYSDFRFSDDINFMVN